MGTLPTGAGCVKGEKEKVRPRGGANGKGEKGQFEGKMLQLMEREGRAEVNYLGGQKISEE